MFDYVWLQCLVWPGVGLTSNYCNDGSQVIDLSSLNISTTTMAAWQPGGEHLDWRWISLISRAKPSLPTINHCEGNKETFINIAVS